MEVKLTRKAVEALVEEEIGKFPSQLGRERFEYRPLFARGYLTGIRIRAKIDAVAQTERGRSERHPGL